MTVLINIISALHGEKPISEPIFFKEDDSADSQLERLRRLRDEAKECSGFPSDTLSNMERDIKLMEFGIAGEKSLAYELKNSHIPMIVIHDLYLEHGGLTAQIDYLIVLRHFSLVLECKNLYGDISIDEGGNFIRTMEYGGRKHREGVYSPITQLQRHMDLIKMILSDEKSNPIMNVGFKHYFQDNYKSLVVLANPKTILHDMNTDSAVAKSVIRCDALVAKIKELEKESHMDAFTDREMQTRAQEWLDRNSANQIDYLEHYETALQEHSGTSKTDIEDDARTIQENPLYEALRRYRYETTSAEGNKPYFLYSNRELEDLVTRCPQTVAELREIKGFGEKKCAKYGDDIIAVVKQFSK